METYLLGYGFAIVLALLSWSDKIKDLQKETYEIENEFARERGSSFIKIRVILSQQKGISLNERIQSLTSFLKKIDSKSDINKTLAIINEFRKLFEARVKLENYIKLKFKMIICLAFYFIISGVIACFISKESHFCISNIKILT